MDHFPLLHNSRSRCVISTLEGRKTFGSGSRTVAIIENILLKRLELRNSLQCPSQVADNEPPRRVAARVPEFVSGLAFSPDGALLVASTGTDFHLFDPHRGKTVRTVREPHDKADLANMSFYTDRKFFCSTTNGCLAFWDARKLDVPLNCFKAHSNPISKILHDKDTNWLLTADKEAGQLRYWYLPALEVKDVEMQDDHNGLLINCPTLNQMCIVEDGINKKLVLSSSNSSSLYIVDNLDLRSLASNRELHRLSIGDNFKMYLGMNPKVTYKGQVNCLQYLEEDEFLPVVDESISSISYMESLPNSSVLVMRLTTSSTVRKIGQQFKDWTLCLQLKKKPQTSYNMFQSYGSNVMHECLLYSLQEPRYCGFKVKKNSVSPCCRIIASPQKQAIKLLSFTDEFHDIRDAIKLKTDQQHHLPSIFTSKSIPKSFKEYATLKYDGFPKAYPLCSQFSPVTTGLLVVGNSTGHVFFYQPQL